MFGLTTRKKAMKELVESFDYSVRSDFREHLAKHMVEYYSDNRVGYRSIDSTMDEIYREAVQQAARTISHDIVAEFKEKVLTEALTDDTVLDIIKNDIKERVTNSASDTSYL